MATKKTKPEAVASVTLGKTMRKAREEGFLLLFPSGNHYRVRFPTAAALLKRGDLPNPLLRFVTDAYYSGVTQTKFDAFMAAQERADAALEMDASAKVICQAMFLEPRVVDEPQADDEVTIDDIPPEDQNWAFQLAFMRAQLLAPFRQEQAAVVERVPKAESVPQAGE